MHAYQNKNLSIPERINDLLGRMTLAEKAGQMTQIEKNSLTPAEVTTHFTSQLSWPTALVWSHLHAKTNPELYMFNGER